MIQDCHQVCQGLLGTAMSGTWMLLSTQSLYLQWEQNIRLSIRFKYSAETWTYSAEVITEALLLSEILTLTIKGGTFWGVIFWDWSEIAKKTADGGPSRFDLENPFWRTTISVALYSGIKLWYHCTYCYFALFLVEYLKNPWQVCLALVNWKLSIILVSTVWW